MPRVEPRYQAVLDDLLDRHRKLTKPLKLAPEVELAQQYGVARTTIRRAMAELEQRGAITRRPGRGTFLHPARTSLKELRRSIIGFIPPWWADSTQAYYTSTVFDGVCKWLEARDGNVSILHVDRNADDEHHLLKQINRRGMDGLIWVHPVPTQANLLAAVARHVPCVSIGREYGSVGLNMVIPDYAQAAQLIDDHLVSQGHHTYSVIGQSLRDPFAQAFAQGFEDAAKSRGSRFESNRYVNITPFNRDRMADLLLDFHLDHVDNPQAIVLTSSSYLGPLLQNDRFRQQLAHRLSIMAFDYGILPMHQYWPGKQISHVACDWREIGKQAMNLLAGLVRRSDDQPRVLRHAVTLVPGQSIHPIAKAGGA